MCTIMTVSYDYFMTHQTVIEQQITKDSDGNGDGWNLILCGEYSTDALNIQCMNIDAVFNILSTIPWDRMWLHSRYSTTKTTGIDGCHGFHTYKGYLIQHNGIISAGGAGDLPVDSMIIAKLFDILNLGDVVSWLHTYANFANVFFVNPNNGKWAVSRTSGGILHTDGEGNYSTNNVATMQTPVGKNYFKEYQEEVKVLNKWSKYYSSSWGKGLPTAQEWKDKLPSHADGMDDLDEDDSRLKDIVDEIREASQENEEWIDPIYVQAVEEEWRSFKDIPKEVWSKLTRKEKKELVAFIDTIVYD